MQTDFFLYLLIDIVNCGNDDKCHKDATCTDGNGSYTCACKDGVIGDGIHCGKIEIILES